MKKKIRKAGRLNNSPLEELLLMMYTPKLMYEFNPTGKNKESFKKTRINRVLAGALI